MKNKIKTQLGLNKGKLLGCGSAAISPSVLEWYHSVGINITEAWGMTETLAFTTLNYPFRKDKIGTVGRPGNGIEIALTDANEVIVRSPGLFKGYYKGDPSLSDIDENGWLHTGDVGKIDVDGYLSITGRIKEVFKTGKGKYVTPTPIEKRFSHFINAEMMCLIGSGMSAPYLLIVPPAKHDKKYAVKLEEALNKMNLELESHEVIRGALIIKKPWSIDDDSLTPTLKIKRHVLEERYKNIEEEWPTGVKVVFEKS